MKIGDKTYFTYDIDQRLQNRLNLKFGSKLGKCTEITLPNKIHINQRKNLITHIVGAYAINNLIFNTRFYTIPYITNKMKRLLRYKPSDMNGKSVGDVIKSLQSRGVKVYIHGGLIRDIFIGVKSYDIDLIFDTNINKVELICKEDNYPCADIDKYNQNINFGMNKGASVEGANLHNTLLNPLYLHEASINDFVYDFENNILIDLTGFGLFDIMYRNIRLSAKPSEWIKWAESDFKRPLRYFKLIQKGFYPVNTRVHKFIIKYIVDNYDTLYDSVINTNAYPVKRIKHFIIKTMTQGDINLETGEYHYGPTKDKLVPYLKVLKKNLPKHIFKKIMSIFTIEDLKLLKTKSIISTLQFYIDTS